MYKFEEGDKVRLASGAVGEIAVLDGQIARVWVDDGLRVVNVSVAVLTPLDSSGATVPETPKPIPPSPTANSINRQLTLFS